MPNLTKYRPVGEVQAAVATDKTLDDLAKLAKGTLFTNPSGTRYALIETSTGTQRLNIGDALVQHGEGRKATYETMAADEFAARYTR